MDAFETFEHAGLTVKLYYDEDAPNPCEDFDMLTHMACWHRRANLGHETIEHMTAKEVIRRANKVGDKILAILPLYLYEHSGMTIRVGKAGNPFADRFDSGQVGWAYVTKADAEKMGCVGVFHNAQGNTEGTWDKARLQEAIGQDVETYDTYLRGENYGYVVEDKDGDQVDSCWGFLGDLDYVRKEAKRVAENEVEDEKKARRRFTKKAWRAAVASGKTEDSYEGWLKTQRADKSAGRAA